MSLCFGDSPLFVCAEMDFEIYKESMVWPFVAEEKNEDDKRGRCRGTEDGKEGIKGR